MNESKSIGIIGSGSRESAFIDALLKDPTVAIIYWFGNNAGYPNDPSIVRTNIAPDDKEGILRSCKDLQLDLIISGPENPSVNGTNDLLRANGFPVFGASQAAIRIESDKAWARETMQKLRLPQPEFEVHQNIEQTKKSLKTNEKLRVVKAAGPCEGKGVVICDTYEEAEAAAQSMLVHNQFGEAGSQIVLEERLGLHDTSAEEVSVMYFTDGNSLVQMPLAQDYKREYDGNKGKNTGGMGSHTAPESLSAQEQEQVRNKIAYPILNELAQSNNPFIGILYVSLMKTSRGIFVIEINGRGGDPETVVQLAGMSHPNFAEFLLACALGNLGTVEAPTWDDNEYVDVVLCAQNYPAGKSKGETITGIKEASKKAQAIFHAGTIRDGQKTLTNGGRILSVVGKGATRQEARDQAYESAQLIYFDGKVPKYRTDIGE
jgi:phosphoribosylamine--glycine ligase